MPGKRGRPAKKVKKVKNVPAADQEPPIRESALASLSPVKPPRHHLPDATEYTQTSAQINARNSLIASLHAEIDRLNAEKCNKLVAECDPLKRRQEELGEEIKRLQEQETATDKRIRDEYVVKIEAVEEKIRLANAKVETDLAFLAPIRRLPIELFSEIFVICVDTGTLPNTLALVCRAWRNIADNTPKLWSKIAIPFGMFRPPYIPPTARLCQTPGELAAALKRAGASSLEISIHISEISIYTSEVDAEDIEASFQVLFAPEFDCLSRATSLSLYVYDYPIESFFPSDANLLRLEYLLLRTTAVGGNLLLLLDSATNLHRLDLSCNITGMEDWPGWATATAITLRTLACINCDVALPYCQALTMLSLDLLMIGEPLLLPTLTQLHIEDADWDCLALLEAPRLDHLILESLFFDPLLLAPVISFPELTSIAVFTSHVKCLASFDIPKINEMRVEITGEARTREMNAQVEECFEDLGTTFPATSLYFGCPLNDAYLIKLVKGFPVLDTLQIFFKEVAGSKILESFGTKPRGKGMAPYVCPYLQDLTLDFTYCNRVKASSKMNRVHVRSILDTVVKQRDAMGYPLSNLTLKWFDATAEEMLLVDGRRLTL